MLHEDATRDKQLMNRMGIASEKNIYGQKQGGRVWNLYLIDKLVNEIGFTQSRHDECILSRKRHLPPVY
jgi:hypothetical protein